MVVVMRVAASASVRAIARRSDPEMMSVQIPKYLTVKLTHNICLGTDGNQAVDVLADGHQDLSSHVSTLLGSWGLVLDVDTSSTLLNEELRQLHHGSQTSVSSIGISDNRAQIVDVGEFRAISFRQGSNTLLTLLAVVEELGHEEMRDFVGDSGLEKSVLAVSNSGGCQ
jgi:hypothetical protein